MGTLLLGQLQRREFRTYVPLIGLVILGFDTFHSISILLDIKLLYDIIDM